jgi:outer membrane autotransporter protein
MIVLNGQRANGILLDRLGSRRAGIADGAVAANGAGVATTRMAANGNFAAIGQIAGALPEALAAEGAWFRGIGGFASVDGSGIAPGFTGTAGGFMAGIDRPVAPGLYLGLAGGYLHSDVDEPSASTGTLDTARVAAYGRSWWGANLFTGTAGYAHDWIASTRGLAGIGNARQSHGGDEVTVAGQWSLPTPMAGIAGSAMVTPKLGFQFLHLSEDGFAETGAGGFSLSSRGHDTDSVQPYIGLAAAETFVTSDGAEITPEIRLGYARELAGNSRVLTVATLSGSNFPVTGVKPSPDMLTAGIGFTMRAAPNAFLYANYDALLPTGNICDQIVSAGLRIRF